VGGKSAPEGPDKRRAAPERLQRSGRAGPWPACRPPRRA